MSTLRTVCFSDDEYERLSSETSRLHVSSETSIEETLEAVINARYLGMSVEDIASTTTVRDLRYKSTLRWLGIGI